MVNRQWLKWKFNDIGRKTLMQINLKSVDKTLPYGIEKLYSMDLKSMISDGTVVLLENK